MTQQYNFILVFCSKSTHTFEGLSLPPPKSCADTSMVGCTRATHVRTDNIEFTSENINKFSIERIWGNLFGKSSCRAASRGVWRSWNTTTPAPGPGKLCSDNCIESTGPEVSTMHLWRDRETSGHELLGKLCEITSWHKEQSLKRRKHAFGIP